MINFLLAEAYAVEHATADFGRDVRDLIQGANRITPKYRFLLEYLNTLTQVFETVALANIANQEEYIDEFYNYVQECLEGEVGKVEIKGIKARFKEFFYHRIFSQDPRLKEAVSLFFRHYITYIKENVEVVPIEDFMELIEIKRYNGDYFDKNKVFGKLIEIVEEAAV